MRSVYDAAGGDEGLLRLAEAWHARVVADEIVGHAFRHGVRPDHTRRLAAYWAEALGGPSSYSGNFGDETSVVELHSGNGQHEEMDQRAIACFDQALNDTGLATDDRLRQTLHDYFASSTATMASYPDSPDDVPAGLRIVRWSWDGPVVDEPGRINKAASSKSRDDMPLRLEIVGAPSSAGAYAPGQERAPAAYRSARLPTLLKERGIAVTDRGDVPGFRWRIDPDHMRAMNPDAAAGVAHAVADEVAAGLSDGSALLVLGGDCTVEIGTVAGASRDTPEVGLVYIDYDTDMNTPQSVEDGALDWMGVAHLLGLPGTIPGLAGVGARAPMLRPDQVLLFANGSSTDFERQTIDELGIQEVPLAQVASHPVGSARGVVDGWARRFDRLLVHVDADVLDFLDFPIAEETRRYRGLRFEQLVAVLRELVAAPNWTTLTICEVNPDHDPDGSSMRRLSEALADILAGAPGLAGGV